jgi:hypothetical protein
MCTQRHIVFTHCACTPVLIIKYSAQEFVEEQAIKSKRKPPLIYKYCVNFMITRDLWTGCCKRRAEGVCFAEGRETKMQREEEHEQSGGVNGIWETGVASSNVEWKGCLGRVRR